MSGRLEGAAGGKSSPLIMPGPLLVSILGIVFCSWSAFGNVMNFCITAGCELNQDANLWGISLWWFGAVAFCILTVLSLSGRAWLGVLAAGFCVLIDLFLVLLMLITSPCVSCLVVGFIFVLAYMAFRHAGKGLDPLPRSKLVAVWMILLVANVGVILRDSPGTWMIYGAEQPSIRVYFSPKCPECITAVKALHENKDAAFYPVAKIDGDFDSIATMLTAMNGGDNIVKALEKAQKPQESTLGFFEELHLHYWLLRNKAEILMSGSNFVPFIEFVGIPQALKSPSKKEEHKKQPAPTPQAPTQEVEPMETIESMDPLNQQVHDDASLPIDLGVAGKCGGETTEPCPEDEPTY